LLDTITIQHIIMEFQTNKNTKPIDEIPSNVFVLKVNVPYDPKIHTHEDYHRMKLDHIITVLQTIDTFFTDRQKNKSN
jgi:hypothetical protein